MRTARQTDILMVWVSCFSTPAHVGGQHPQIKAVCESRKGEAQALQGYLHS